MRSMAFRPTSNNCRECLLQKLSNQIFYPRARQLNVCHIVYKFITQIFGIHNRNVIDAGNSYFKLRAQTWCISRAGYVVAHDHLSQVKYSTDQTGYCSQPIKLQLLISSLSRAHPLKKVLAHRQTFDQKIQYISLLVPVKNNLLRRLVPLTTKSYVCNFAQKMRNVPFCAQLS